MLVAMFAVSCQDERYLMDDTGDGDALVSAEVTFQPLASALEYPSRTAGNVIKQIKTLDVLIYDSNGKLVRSYDQSTLPAYTVDQAGNTSMPNIDKENPTDPTPTQAESTTARAKFQIPGLPFGRYKIYAVANISLSDEEKQDIELVKTKVLSWNPTDIASNNAMFGYFTPGSAGVQNNGADGFDAPLLIVNKNMVDIHAWIKRAVSKVTVAFDGSGLHPNVYIYVKSVTLHDIPKTCYLGADNKPDNASQLYNRKGESPLANSVLYYSRQDALPSDNSGNAKDPGTDWKNNWMRIANGLGNAKGVLGSTHSENANALYFFENNQGNFEGQPDFDKRQKWDSVGVNITEPAQPDYKDNVPYGTYIEVEAYYVSENVNNITSGPIKYRFMLGKNITYNYNASRNHHFKLTLGFRGWANQPDWHIEYEEPAPSLYVPESFRVSYLYNQVSTMPIKVVGDCTGITMEIVENNWAPCDTSGVNPPAVLGSGDYAFKWNTVAYSKYNGTAYPYLGFLALQVPDNRPTNIIDDMAFSSGTTALNALKSYYNGTGNGNTQVNQSKRSFSAGDLSAGKHPSGTYNGWEVEEVGDEDNSKIVRVPLFTRNKTMIYGSGYSGNNPYEAYNRKAVVKVTATFRNGTKIEKYVTVMQARRITNPKGVWRKWDDKQSFHVLLTNQASGFTDTYQSFESQGDWEAYIELPAGGVDFAALRCADSDTTKWKNENGRIYGKTLTPVSFYIDFKGVGQNETKCAVVRVNYHGRQCVHKIMLRQGYMKPIQVMGDKYWSSFSLYKATWISGNNDGHNDKYTCEITKNPLALGSFFRRGIQSTAIYVSNNDTENLKPFQAPGSTLFSTAKGRLTWSGIGYRDDRYANNGFTADQVRDRDMGTFTATVNGKVRTYRVPTWEEFNQLMSAEFGFGVLYGDGATETQLPFTKAHGLQDANNTGTSSDMGARGIIVYNPTTANQIFFPVGKNGIGRRRQFNFATSESSKYGMLIYSDVNEVLNTTLTLEGDDTSAKNKYNNQFRPIPYNLIINPGAIYWIDKYKADGHIEAGGTYPSMGWDMNYFSFDFGSYTANNYRDACPIKLIVKEGY